MKVSGVIKSEMLLDNDDTMYHKTSQPTEDLILSRNAELRKNPGAILDLGAKSSEGTWGRQIASIPFIMFNKAIRDGYQLNARDGDIAEKELFRYLRSEEGRKCLIVDGGV
jgi:hypothetical protein